MRKVKPIGKMSKKLYLFVSVLLALSFCLTFFTACKDNEVEDGDNAVYLDEIKNIPENSLYIEWLSQGYNVEQPTMIFIHGETPGRWDKKFSMTLDEENYIYYAQNSTYYNVTRNLDIDRVLYQYWLKQNYNIGIFHYENFADDDLEKLSKKLFNSVDMRYKTEDGYENVKIPNYSLTEILAAVFINEIPEEAFGMEIRLVGNGVGANLALALSDYLYTFYEKGKIKPAILPSRLSLIDPYLSPDSIKNNIGWRKIDQNLSMLELTDNMLEYTTERGLVAEIVENVEVTAEIVGDKSQEVLVSPYDYVYSNEEKDIKENIKDKAAYLFLRQKYSLLYSDEYRAQNRAGVDWYLYSINGSDDTGVGYLTSKPDYTSSYCNWGRYETRPIINDRQRNNNSSRGKNYAVGAWTETVWIRALKGIEFHMKRYKDYLEDEDGKIIKDKHGISLYEYEDYHLERFRSENYQKAINMDRTIIAGYIWNDKNEDRIMNDGVDSYLGGLTVNVELTTSVDGETKTVESFSVTTGRDGFYKITFDRSFQVTHTANITIVPPNRRYHVQTAALASYHVADLTKHTFNKNTKSITLSSNYGDAITMASCGMVVK